MLVRELFVWQGTVVLLTLGISDLKLSTLSGLTVEAELLGLELEPCLGWGVGALPDESGVNAEEVF